jgi:uncharacterized protein (TIGR04141 family)
MRITLYLLRHGLEPARALLRNADRFTEVALQPPGDPSVSWRLYTYSGETQPVCWLSSLQTIAATPDLLALFRRSAGAVLLASVDGRTFAVTFGTGFHAINPTHVEQDFGLRVTANCINPDQMNLAEARGLGKGARNAVSSLPVPNRMFALRLATNEEWIRRIGGRSLDNEFAISASGADSLRLTIDDFSLWDLPRVLRKSIEKFESTAYRDHLPQLDNFRRLAKQHPAIPLLEELVVEELKARQPDLGFAAPDEFHFYNVDYFELKRRRVQVVLHDLSTEGVYAALDELDAWGDPLGSVKVRAVSEGDALGPPRPLQQYVVADVPLEEHGELVRYVLTAGAWFSIDPTYAAHLETVLARVPEVANFSLPTWDDQWLHDNIEGRYAEQRYNRHAATATGYCLVDRDLYHGAAGERVEACDLLTKGKALVCVKRLDGSDTMIHLFEQGALSATLLKNNEEYRAFVLDRLTAAGGVGEYGTEGDWTVVFAIATSRPGPIKDLLPFFARASLAANLDAITDRGYALSLTKILMV